jgi:hypothetical protein
VISSRCGAATIRVATLAGCVAGYATLFARWSEPADCELQGSGRLRYTRRLFRKFDLRVLPAMEINPILNSIKDLSERTQTIRGYL